MQDKERCSQYLVSGQWAGGQCIEKGHRLEALGQSWVKAGLVTLCPWLFALLPQTKSR